MGFRFRRSIRILPGIRLNLSKSGVSTSIGVRGAHVTMGHGKVRETIGLPGTGLSYTHVDARQAHDALPNEAPVPAERRRTPWFSIAVLLGLLAFLVHLIRLGLQ